MGIMPPAFVCVDVMVTVTCLNSVLSTLESHSPLPPEGLGLRGVKLRAPHSSVHSPPAPSKASPERQSLWSPLGTLVLAGSSPALICLREIFSSGIMNPGIPKILSYGRHLTTLYKTDLFVIHF